MSFGHAFQLRFGPRMWIINAHITFGGFILWIDDSRLIMLCIHFGEVVCGIQGAREQVREGWARSLHSQVFFAFKRATDESLA